MTLGRARLVVLLATVAGAGLTASLGMWQLRRAEFKQLAHDVIQQQASRPAWGNADWPCRAKDPADLPLQRPVRLSGHWLNARTVLLENRSMDGLSGFDVLTPLVLDTSGGGACAGRLVLVQRGWVPRDPRDRLKLPALPALASRVVVPGRVVAEPSRVYQIGQEAAPAGPGPLVRQNVDAAFWQAWLGQSPLAGAVLQLQAEDVLAEQADQNGMGLQAHAVSDALLRHWPAPDLGKGKHLAYAAQWFALAALIMGLYVWYQLIRPRRALAHDGHVPT